MLHAIGADCPNVPKYEVIKNARSLYDLQKSYIHEIEEDEFQCVAISNMPYYKAVFLLHYNQELFPTAAFALF